MDVLQKLKDLTDARGWTVYRLSKESGLSESTLRNIFCRNTMPSIHTLDAICAAFDLSLSQFFAEGELIEYTPELKRLLDTWVPLTKEQKESYLALMDVNRHDRSKPST